MIITDEIRAALEKLCEKSGSQKNACEKVKMSPGAFNRLLGKCPDDRTESIRNHTWEKIYPWIELDIPDEPLFYPRSKLIKIVKIYHNKQKVNEIPTPS